MNYYLDINEDISKLFEAQKPVILELTDEEKKYTLLYYHSDNNSFSGYTETGDYIEIIPNRAFISLFEPGTM